MSDWKCVRCQGEAGTGASVSWSGPATGHNIERRVLCEDCVKMFQVFLSPGEHVKASDAVTSAGLAHITMCRECNARFGGGVAGFVSRETSPVTISKQRVAERFTRRGLAQ